MIQDAIRRLPEPMCQAHKTVKAMRRKELKAGIYYKKLNILF